MTRGKYSRTGFALGMIALATLAGCGKKVPLATSGPVRVVDATELPPPGTREGVIDSAGYMIGVSDKLIVDVVGFEQISQRRVLVDGSGRIDIPLAGSIVAAGRTPSQLSAQIAQRLRAAYVRNPEVSVNVEEAVSRVVTVEGQVAQPGNYPIINDMTLMRSVAAARGLSEFADIEDVVVFRTVNGQRMAALYNLGAIRRGYYADPAIYSQDIVVVGNSESRRIFRDILTASPLLVGPLVAILSN